jgi:hypothetical protein
MILICLSSTPQTAELSRKITIIISVRVLIQKNQSKDKENKDGYFCDAGPSRARGQAGILVGNLKHLPSWLCCPLLHPSLPLTLWRVRNHR